MADKTLNEKYVEAISKKVDSAQASADVPSLYTFNLDGRVLVCTLPRSVMTQKRMIYSRNKYLTEGSFEAEEEFVKMICENTTMDNRPLNINDLSLGEIEVLKTAYMDELLLPLSLGGDKALQKYMQTVVGK